MTRLRGNAAAATRPSAAASATFYRLANEGNAEALEVRLLQPLAHKHHDEPAVKHVALPPATIFNFAVVTTLPYTSV